MKCVYVSQTEIEERKEKMKQGPWFASHLRERNHSKVLAREDLAV